jgi:peroxin-11B
MSLPSSLPENALRFLDWLKKTDGRDKLYRLVAYGSKIPIHLLKQNGGDKELIQKLSKGASQVGLTRKLLRMFRSVQFLQDFLSSNTIKDPIERGLGMIKSFALFIWMIIDHAQWFHKAGYIKLNYEKKLSEIHSKAWFVGLLFGTIQSTYKLKVLQLKEKDSNSKEKEFKLKQGIVKNSIDLVIPCARLGWLDVSDGAVGVAGTITSVIGIKDTFPSKK